MNNYPLVSIIVPVYGVEKYLPKCLDSIIAQTYHNIEIMLIDDGSPDRCGEICDEYAAKDKRIKVIHKKNEGVTEARIAGFEASTGEYISFVDSDDYISKDYINHLYTLITEYHVELACCQFYSVFGEKLIPDNRSSMGYFDRKRIEQLLSTNFLFDKTTKKAAFFPGQCAKIMSRNLVAEALYKSRGLKWGEDITMLFYVLYRIQSFYVSQAANYYYVQHKGQTTRSNDLNSWYNLVSHWKSLITLDSRNYLTEQLSYRILYSIQVFAKNNLIHSVPYKDFKGKIHDAISNEVVEKYFYQFTYKNLSLFDRLFVLLIKNEIYWPIYGLGKIIVDIYYYRRRFKVS